MNFINELKELFSKKEDITNEKTDRGKELYQEYSRIRNRYYYEENNKFNLDRETENWLLNLSDYDFGTFIYQPMGNIARSHLTHLRELARIDNILVHVPHASIEFPDFFWDYTYSVNKNYIENENIFLSDYLVDLFIPEYIHNIVKFKYSRMFCDVEKYKVHYKESMSKYGMGAVYKKDSNGIGFIRYGDEYENFVLKNYYDTHHKNLKDQVLRILKYNKSCIIIDLHSFSNKYIQKIFGNITDVDICIGVDAASMNKELTIFTIKYFKRNGYTVKINNPFKGTVVPEDIDLNENKVYSLMIEINKKLYLNSNKYLNNKKYKKLKKVMDDYFNEIKKEFKEPKRN